MAINLTKGQSINLDKATHDLSSITIGLGWKIKKKKQGMLKKMLGGEPEFDLDAVCFLLGPNGKINNLGNQLKGSDVIFFNNLSHYSGAIRHTGDNLVGGAGVEDDEQIIVKLDKLGDQFQSIKFLVTIYEGTKRKQDFGQVESAFMRAVDAKGKEIARFNLSDDPMYNGMRSMMFGEVTRDGGNWKFSAIGDAHPADMFLVHLKDYVDA